MLSTLCFHHNFLDVLHEPISGHAPVTLGDYIILKPRSSN